MVRSMWLTILSVGAVSIGMAVMIVGPSVPDIGIQSQDAVVTKPPVVATGLTLPRSGPRRDHRAVDAGQHRDWQAINARIERKRKKLLTDGPPRHDEPQEAMDFFLMQRLPEGRNVLPLETLQAARLEIETRMGAVGVKGEPTNQRAITGWTELGPPNIGGRTRSLVINPVNPEMIYAAGVAGGVWKSTDAGESWFATDDLMANLAVSSLAMDPIDPSILYAGTGEGFFNGDAVRGLGMFKTIDAGVSWTQLAGTVTGVPFGAFFRVNEIVISPADHLRVYAATRYGVWKSIDGGGNWSVVLQNPSFLAEPVPSSNGSSSGCLDVAIRTDTAPGPDTLLAAFGTFSSDGLFRSTDNGATWTQVGTGADLLVSGQGRMEISIAPSDNDIVYVSMASTGGGTPFGAVVDIFRSDDGGVTWTGQLDLGGNNPNNQFLLGNLAFGNGCFGFNTSGQGWYDNVIKVDPVDPDIVWVGGVDLFRSDDAGINFGLASYWYFDSDDVKYVHADQHAITFHPDYDGVTNQSMYSGSDGGLARTDNARAATTPLGCPSQGDPLPDINWVNLNNGYGVTQFFHGDSAKNTDIYGGGCQDNGTNIVDFIPPTTDWHEVIGGDGGYFAIHPTNSLVMYGETQGFPRIRKSVDGGATFVSATNGITDTDGMFITPFAMDQSNPEILWTGGRRPWRTTNGANSWTLAGPNLIGSSISAITIAPSDSEIVYVGAFGGIARSSDALNAVSMPTWTIFNGGNGLPAATISSIAVHPTDPDIAYFTISTFDIDHVFRTIDGGNAWTAIDDLGAPTGIPNLPAHWIAVRPCNPDELYVGTELGVFESSDAGTTWAPANTGFANTVVESLDFQNDYTLVAFTHGRGAFRATLSCPCDPASPFIDCNGNLDRDECDVAFGGSPDCNDNSIPDECELAGNDCNGNGIPDECEEDCQPNGIPDSCDVNPGDPDGNGLVSDDCNANGIPDECEPDCNANGAADDCDIDAGDPDGNGEVSPDCNANGFPDECDILGGGVLSDVDFETGLPAGWSTSGIFSVTGACDVQPTCDDSMWAYAGDTGSCTYDDDQFGELVSPPIKIGPTNSRLSFCSMLDTEPGFDFAEVFVNDDLVFREAEHIEEWVSHEIDLGDYAGQRVTLTFRLASDGGVSGTIGWQVDQISVASGSSDCDGSGVPDECEVLDDCDGDGIADLCEPDSDGDGVPDDCDPCPDDDGDHTDDSDGDSVPDLCDVCPGGDDTIDLNGNGLPDACEMESPTLAAPPHDITKNRYISIVPGNIALGTFDIEISLVSTQVAGVTAVGSSWWANEPDADCISIVGATRPLTPPDWNACPDVVHLTGCPIIPTSFYDIVAVDDEVESVPPLAAATQAKPGIKWHGDCVGSFTGTEWTAPNGQTSIDDAVAAIKTFQTPSKLPGCGSPPCNATHTSVTDVAPNLTDPPAQINKIVNIEDVLIIILGFQGNEYPGSQIELCPD